MGNRHIKHQRSPVAEAGRSIGHVLTALVATLFSLPARLMIVQRALNSKSAPTPVPAKGFLSGSAVKSSGLYLALFLRPIRHPQSDKVMGMNIKICIAFFCMIFASSILNAEQQDDYTRLWNMAENGQFVAAVHARYHNGYATWYAKWDRWSRWITIFTAAIAAAAPAILKKAKIPTIWNSKKFGAVPLKLFVNRTALIVVVLGIVISTYLQVHPYNDWRTDHKVAYREWNALKGQWERLKVEYPKLSTEEAERTIVELQAEERAVEKSEPLVSNSTFMETCQKQEEAFQNKSNPAAIDQAGQKHANNSR